MNEEKPYQNIHERIYQVILKVLLMMRGVPKTADNLIIINQLSRSITSMGANDQEADGAESKSDFIHKYSIARKEAKESSYWIRLLGDLNPRLKQDTDSLIVEIDEISRIISAIIHKTKQRIKT